MRTRKEKKRKEQKLKVEVRDTYTKQKQDITADNLSCNEPHKSTPLNKCQTFNAISIESDLELKGV